MSIHCELSTVLSLTMLANGCSISAGQCDDIASEDDDLIDPTISW